MDLTASPWYTLTVIATLAVSAAFKPWRVLRHAPLQSPWLMALVLLPWVWWARALTPSGMGFHLSGACLLVLMFGWPMAMLMCVAIGALAAALTAYGPAGMPTSPMTSMLATAHASSAWATWDAIAAQIVWAGMLPGTLALLLGLGLRRYLPRHLFIYILGRGFFGTVAAMALTAVMTLISATSLPIGLSAGDWLLGHWLMAWGEGIATGMLVAIFVAFRPQWLLTYSDQRYLHKERP